MRYRGRVDKIQNEVVLALRAAGSKVAILSNLGGGIPDLAVYSPATGKFLFMEVKSPGGRLTDDELDFYHQWQEVEVVVYSVEDALKAIEVSL